MKAPKPETSYELCPAGTHVARLYKIINLGTHEEEHNGEKSNKAKIRLYWELPTEMKTFTKEVDGKKEEVTAPFAISRELTFSMHEKSNLRPLVEGMIGTTLNDDEAYDFDIEALIGKACIITVQHETGKSTGNKFALVASTSPLMKGMDAPEQVNESEVIDVEDVTEAMLADMPNWLADKFRASAEWKARGNQAPTAAPAAAAAPAATQDAPDFPEDEINPEDIPF